MNLRIGILTWFIGSNLGAVLQAKALQYKIQTLFPDECCETIYYQTQNQVVSKKKYGLIRVVKNFIIRRSIKDFYIELYMLPINKRRWKQIDKFISENMKVSIPYIGDAIEKANEEYDIFICGSDQIWNPEWLDTRYLLDFVKRGKKRIAYAPSIGMDYIPDEHRETIKDELKEFAALSVRERQSVECIQSLIKNKVVTDVCDPTLLLKQDEWKQILKLKASDKEPYIFCYFLSREKKYRDYVCQFAKREKLSIINLAYANGYNEADKNFKAKKVYCISPQHFLELIAGASLVFTDSFHGVVFSILQEKRFWVFERNITALDGRNMSINSRVDNLLEKLKLKERKVSANDFRTDSKSLNQDIDYKLVEQLLRKYRQESIAWLKDSILREGTDDRKNVSVCR